MEVDNGQIEKKWFGWCSPGQPAVGFLEKKRQKRAA